MEFKKWWEDLIRVLTGNLVIYEITPGLFQSSKFNKKDWVVLEKLGIDFVIDLEGAADEKPDCVRELKYWKIEDKLEMPSEEELDNISRWGAEKIILGFKVLTHCQFGRNRSGLVDGEILKKLGWPGIEAFKRIQGIVPGALENRVFAEYVKYGKYEGRGRG